MTQAPLAPFSQLYRFTVESLPLHAMAESYLVDMQWDPAFSKDRSFEEFSDNALHELRHHAALWGALLRLDRGDPTAWSSIGLNLARLLYRRRITQETAARLPDAVRQDPRGQSMLRLIEEGDRHLQEFLPVMLQIIHATGWDSAAPMAPGQE